MRDLICTHPVADRQKVEECRFGGAAVRRLLTGHLAVCVDVLPEVDCGEAALADLPAKPAGQTRSAEAAVW